MLCNVYKDIYIYIYICIYINIYNIYIIYLYISVEKKIIYCSKSNLVKSIKKSCRVCGYRVSGVWENGHTYTYMYINGKYYNLNMFMSGEQNIYKSIKK